MATTKTKGGRNRKAAGKKPPAPDRTPEAVRLIFCRVITGIISKVEEVEGMAYRYLNQGDRTKWCDGYEFLAGVPSNLESAIDALDCAMPEFPELSVEEAEAILRG